MLQSGRFGEHDALYHTSDDAGAQQADATSRRQRRESRESETHGAEAE